MIANAAATFYSADQRWRHITRVTWSRHVFVVRWHISSGRHGGRMFRPSARILPTSAIVSSPYRTCAAQWLTAVTLSRCSIKNCKPFWECATWSVQVLRQILRTVSAIYGNNVRVYGAVVLAKPLLEFAQFICNCSCGGLNSFKRRLYLLPTYFNLLFLM